MNTRRFTALALTAIAALALAGCAVPTYGEYAIVSDIKDLAAQSTEIVEVQVVSHQDRKLIPEPFTGDDPKTNPYAGTGLEQPSPEELATDVVIYTAIVVDPITGPTKPETEIQIHQLARDEHLTYLEDGNTYVLFLLTAEGHPAGIIGGDQGAYLVEGDRYTPLNKEAGLALDLATIESLRSK